MKIRENYSFLFLIYTFIYNFIYMLHVLEIDWSSFVDDSLFQAAEILSANAVITTVNSYSSVPYVRHIDWYSLANIYIKTKKMRNKYTNFLDEVDELLPDDGEEPRPGMTQNDIEYYDNMRNEGYRLLEIGDAKLHAFNWDSITSNPVIPNQEQVVGLLMTVCEYQIIV